MATSNLVAGASLLVPDPMAPVATPVTVRDECSGRVLRACIECAGAALTIVATTL